MDDLLLAADIGGTKTNIALYPRESTFTPNAERTYFNRDFDGFEPLLWQFMEETGLTARAACFAVAGASRDGHYDMPNLGWCIDGRTLGYTFGFQHVSLLNDLEATAHGIATLAPDQFAVVNEGNPDLAGNIALIAAGTGLGEALLIPANGGMHVSASEGGHADFAPHDEEQIALLRFLQTRHEHVSWERVVSGNGLKSIYDFLKSDMGFQEPAWLTEQFVHTDDHAAVITESALHETSGICIRAMDIFMAAYGAEAGNLALKALSTGGFYIGGGIAPKILPKFFEGTFISAFLNKGRFAPLLAEMPVKVILEPKTALRGAAAYCHDKTIH